MRGKKDTRLPVVLRGYDREQVDGLLEEIRRSLNGGAPLTADEVRARRFDVVLRGYDPRAVDELVCECIRDLQAAGPIGERAGRPRVHPDWLISWIQNARFPSVRVRTGYDVRDVDAFLERVIAGLRGTAPPVTPADVRASVFRMTRLSPGYDVGEVDTFLTQLTDALERR
ncbi:DivIVA domain-containing protein [Actinomadura sp. WMMB 499]|uniref:DivIVA domain-containing protein n=1 Tax=Actinomadura sp. WMMB 499 TaxID=1219491 RepID=UPI0012479132|nr:DivIVA domain-containing protein [Actinomadura sp. WMMB 499]QFG25489.1 DivIVA domain-containing protein [Actinomadura sp. WMMB 499]